MIIKSATFITSVASADKFYKTDKPLIAVAGKSNVGKSSFINMLANNSKLARTSVTPGRTRLINYFDFGSFVLADLPGYGFAKVSKEEKLKWAYLLESFFATEKIAHLFSLIDIRHAPTEDDLSLIAYLYRYQIPFSLAATKADKLGKSRIKPQINFLAASLRVGEGDVTAVSAVDKRGKDEILRIIDKVLKNS